MFSSSRNLKLSYISILYGRNLKFSGTTTDFEGSRFIRSEVLNSTLWIHPLDLFRLYLSDVIPDAV